MAETMGQIIRRLRKEHVLTQEELAERLNISAPAISKWENGTAMPDISQIVPLATVFGVSADTLFGLEGTNANDEALKIIGHAESREEYGKLDTYLEAYDIMIGGLSKYPSNLLLLTNCMCLGLSLALPENGWMYAEKRANEIADETIRQADLIISYSKSTDDIMKAHQALLLLYSSAGNFEKAASEAKTFPVQPNYTLYSNMATVNEYMKDYKRESAYLCTEIDYSLQNLEDSSARPGKAYYNDGRYYEAITVFETFFAVMNAVFPDGVFPPYHDFDSGDCYILLSRAYLAVGDTVQAMDNIERSIFYYFNICSYVKGGKLERRALMNTPFVNGTEINIVIDKSALKKKLTEKLSAFENSEIKDSERFKALQEKIADFTAALY